MNLQTLRLVTTGISTTVFLNRPDARNAMNMLMCEELLAVFQQLRFDTSVRSVIIRGEGTAFCAGVDIKELIDKPVEWVSQRRHRGLDAFLAIERCPLPVVSVVHGAVFGAGAEIAAASDFIIAADTALFQWPEALRGSVGATQRLPRSVGRQLAKELLFTARKIDATEALRSGFVNRVVATDNLDAAVAETTAAIERCGATAVRLIKEAINTGSNCDRMTAIDIERQLIDQSLLHDEWRSAIAEFAKNPRS